MTAIRPFESFSSSRWITSHAALERYLTSALRITNNTEITIEELVETSPNRQIRTIQSLRLTLQYDNDQNGIVDGSGDDSTPYQIYNNGDSLTITNRNGRTYNQESSRQWDITAAANCTRWRVEI